MVKALVTYWFNFHDNHNLYILDSLNQRTLTVRGRIIVPLVSKLKRSDLTNKKIF